MKKGDKVKMINCGEAEYYPDKIWECRTDSFCPKNYPDELVIMLEGYAGWFLCEYLQKVL